MSDHLPGFAGRSIEQVQREFFLGRLSRANGRFRYPKSGLDTERDAIVLFQFKARIIALARFVRDEKFDRPTDGFAGVMHFEVASIRTFEPWTAADLRAVWPGFRAFGHVKQFLNPGNWPEFVRLLRTVGSHKTAQKTQ